MATGGCQKLGVRGEKWVDKIEASSEHWKCSVWYCNDGYMSHICQNPNNVQYQECSFM
jgi:hypothetical protein